MSKEEWKENTYIATYKIDSDYWKKLEAWTKLPWWKKLFKGVPKK